LLRCRSGMLASVQMSQQTYCPYCERPILPGQNVVGVKHEDPFRALWHRTCRDTWDYDEKIGAAMMGAAPTVPR